MSSDPTQGTTMPAVMAPTMSLPGVGAWLWVLPTAQQHQRVWRVWPCHIWMVSCDHGCLFLLLGWPQQSC